MYKPGMVAQASNSSLWEAEVGSIRKVLKVSCGYLLHSRPARDMGPLLKRREVGGEGRGNKIRAEQNYVIYITSTESFLTWE